MLKKIEKDFHPLTEDQCRKITIGKLVPEIDPTNSEPTKND